MAFASPGYEDVGKVGVNDDQDPFEAQLDLFREDAEEVSPPSSSHLASVKIPASFYKSSPSLVGEEEATEQPQQGPQEEGEKKNVDLPPYRTKETSTSWQTVETEDTSSVSSHTSESTVEHHNTSPQAVEEEGVFCSAAPSTAALERQVQMLLKEAELREESMQMMAMELERSERKNQKRVAKLKNQVAKLTKETQDYPKQLQYWKQKALTFSKKVYELEVQLDEKEEEIEDLLEYKHIQDDRVELLGKEIEQLKSERHEERLIALERAEECCDKLMMLPKRDITRRASTSALMDLSFSTEVTVDLDDSFDKEDEEPEEDNVHDLETKVSLITQEKARMETELEEMRHLLDESYAKERAAQVLVEKFEKKSSKGSERRIYQVTCKKCPKGKSCSVVGVTTDDLKAKILALAKQSATAAAECHQKVGRPRLLGGLLHNHHHDHSSDASPADNEEESREVVFVKHLASHVPKKVAKNEKEALSYCRKMIRVEVLKKVGGEEELYWQGDENVVVRLTS